MTEIRYHYFKRKGVKDEREMNERRMSQAVRELCLRRGSGQLYPGGRDALDQSGRALTKI
jgi:hypothetical protein